MRKPEMTKQSIEEIFAPMVDLLVKKNHDYKGASLTLVWMETLFTYGIKLVGCVA